MESRVLLYVLMPKALLEDIMYMGEVVRINIKLVLMILLKVKMQAGEIIIPIDNEGSMGVMIWY
jgi:hypothetical protein